MAKYFAEEGNVEPMELEILTGEYVPQLCMRGKQDALKAKLEMVDCTLQISLVSLLVFPQLHTARVVVAMLVTQAGRW